MCHFHFIPVLFHWQHNISHNLPWKPLKWFLHSWFWSWMPNEEVLREKHAQTDAHERKQHWTWTTLNTDASSYTSLHVLLCWMQCIVRCNSLPQGALWWFLAFTINYSWRKINILCIYTTVSKSVIFKCFWKNAFFLTVFGSCFHVFYFEVWFCFLFVSCFPCPHVFFAIGSLVQCVMCSVGESYF